MLLLSPSLYDHYAYANNPFFENGYFTVNGIEWCQENQQLYDILGEKFFEHHKHSLESRVCANLYEDPLWEYDKPDRIQKLVEKSRHYSQLEIAESFEESQTGIIDTTPVADKDEEIVLRGITEDGQITVQIMSSKPATNSPMSITISFLDDNSALISDVSYSLNATQLKIPIISNSNGYSDTGMVRISTPPLQSDDPVDISVMINGIGMPGDDMEYNSTTKGQVLMFTVVPEFGTLASIMILIVAILPIVMVTRQKYSNNYFR